MIDLLGYGSTWRTTIDLVNVYYLAPYGTSSSHISWLRLLSHILLILQLSPEYSIPLQS